MNNIQRNIRCSCRDSTLINDWFNNALNKHLENVEKARIVMTFSAIKRQSNFSILNRIYRIQSE